MKGYSVRLKFGTAFKDFYFQIDTSDDSDIKWDEACKELDKVGDSCKDGKEFFEKVIEHFASYGFVHIEK
jgi:hypothetical protein